METPLSARRVTMSQTRATSSTIPISNKGEELETDLSKSKQRKAKPDRSALLDITNDSPIVGLAVGSFVGSEGTPISSLAKQRSKNLAKRTPGSGEALLRGQVKTLLQKVEEEDAEISKFSLEEIDVVKDENPPFLALKRYLLLAPTPANTPLVAEDISKIDQQLKVSEVVVDESIDGKSVESDDKCIITRSLLSDFSAKSELSTTAVESSHDAPPPSPIRLGIDPVDAEDVKSIWSIQVNASSTHGEEEDCYYDDELVEVEVEEDYRYYCSEDEEEEKEEQGGYFEEEGLIDELCEGMSKMTVKYTGKHTRFIYDTSDDELVGEEELAAGGGDVAAGVLKLKGLPTPKGKHKRFDADDED